MSLSTVARDVLGIIGSYLSNEELGRVRVTTKVLRDHLTVEFVERRDRSCVYLPAYGGYISIVRKISVQNNRTYIIGDIWSELATSSLYLVKDIMQLEDKQIFPWMPESFPVWYHNGYATGITVLEVPRALPSWHYHEHVDGNLIRDTFTDTLYAGKRVYYKGFKDIDPTEIQDEPDITEAPTIGRYMGGTVPLEWMTKPLFSTPPTRATISAYYGGTNVGFYSGKLNNLTMDIISFITVAHPNDLVDSITWPKTLIKTLFIRTRNTEHLSKIWTTYFDMLQRIFKTLSMFKAYVDTVMDNPRKFFAGINLYACNHFILDYQKKHQPLNSRQNQFILKNVLVLLPCDGLVEKDIASRWDGREDGGLIHCLPTRSSCSNPNCLPCVQNKVVKM